MELGSDKSTLRAFLHRLVLVLARFDEGDILFCGLFDDIGSDTVEGLGDIVERKGGIGFGSENTLDAEVLDSRRKLLPLECRCWLVRISHAVEAVFTSPCSDQRSTSLEREDSVVSLPGTDGQPSLGVWQETHH